jgi:DNA polymerase-3 subunit alpha/error-prone DNA polymerase
MAKMPLSLIQDMPIQKTLQFKATELRGDISTTERAPYPQEHEINLPRIKMVKGNKHAKVHDRFFAVEPTQRMHQRSTVHG